MFGLKKKEKKEKPKKVTYEEKTNRRIELANFLGFDCSKFMEKIKVTESILNSYYESDLHKIEIQ